MTSKRETVAAAIYAEYCRRMHAVNGWEGIKSPAWEDLAESSRNDYRMTADVVFMELRNPTPKMILAGRKKPEVPPEEQLRVGTADCDVNAIRMTADRLVENGEANGIATIMRYQAMIDAAMK